MSSSWTIDLAEPDARAIERAAQAAGQTPEAFVAEAAALRARALAEAEVFFAERSKNADIDALKRLLDRDGGEPPRPGDEID